ncbi:MAG: polysaccharide biosynthesis C-terminal domain-containing protein, partial [Tannerellaceae bacterium]
LEIIKKIIGVLILAVSVPLGVVAMCIGQVLSSIIALTINTYYTGKLLDLGFSKQMKDILPILISSLTMGWVIYGVISFITASLWQLIAGGMVGIFCYFILSIFTKQKEYSIIRSIVCKQ